MSMKFKKIVMVLAAFAAASTSYGASSNNKKMATMMDWSGGHTSRITFNGMVQFDYNFVGTDVKGNEPRKSPAAYSKFGLRRVYFGMHADLAENWYAYVNLDLAGSQNNTQDAGHFDQDPSMSSSFEFRGPSASASIETAMIYWDWMPEINFGFGFKKVPFGYEENIDNSKLKAIERSIASNYFVNLGAKRHTGLYLSGEFMQDMGMYYDAAIVSPTTDNVTGRSIPNNNSASSNNSFSYFVSAGMKNEFHEVMFDIGGGLGYVPAQRAAGLAGLTGPYGRDDLLWHVYANFDWEQFNLMGEVFGSSQKKAGHLTGNNREPVGFTLQPSFRLNDQWEIVGVYSYVNADDAGNVMPSQIMHGANDRDGTTGDQQLFDRMTSFYLGGSYFILGDDVVLSAGYQYGRAKNNGGTRSAITVNDSPVAMAAGTGKKQEYHAARVRLQLLF